MLTIKLDSQAFNHKDQIISRLEDEIIDLALYHEYEVVQDDFQALITHKVSTMITLSTLRRKFITCLLA